MLITKIVTLILQIVALVFFVCYLDLLSFFLFLFSLTFPAVLFVINRKSKKCISAEIYCDSIAVNKDDEITFRININNSGRLPVPIANLKICYFNTLDKQKQYANIVFPIQSNNKHCVKLRIASQYCGKLHVNVESILLYDFIKLFSSRLACNCFAEVLVLPQAKALNAVCSRVSESFIESEKFSKTKSGDDPSEIFAIRDFADGDRLNRIHWKLSSKTDSLIVKEYSRPINCSVLLVPDFCFDMKDELALLKNDSLVETIFSISEIMLFELQPYNIGWYSNLLERFDVTTIENDEDFFDFIGAVFDSGTYSSRQKALASFCSECSETHYSHIIYFTSTLTQDTVDALRYGCNAQRKTLLYITDKSELEAQAILNEMNFDLPCMIVPLGRIDAFAGELII